MMRAALSGPETMTPEEIEAEFVACSEDISSTRTDQLVIPPPQLDGVYNFDELDNVDK